MTTKPKALKCVWRKKQTNKYDIIYMSKQCNEQDPVFGPCATWTFCPNCGRKIERRGK